METYLCENKCCVIKLKPYTRHKKYYNLNYKKHKAGVFIYDPKTNKILLVQSNGNLWGPPKGTLKSGETYQECAIREVQEETGLIVNEINFSRRLSLGDLILCTITLCTTIWNIHKLMLRSKVMLMITMPLV
jgi:8-oxo-dGTP pyrophosphatase MutT (NUDIX family)